MRFTRGASAAAAAGLLFNGLHAAAAAAAHANCDAAAIANYLPVTASAHLLSATQVEQNGTYGPQGYDPDFPGNATGLPSLCAVVFNVTGLDFSYFTFGMYLPDQWNNRLMGVGNTGFGGGIDWTEAAPMTHYGFATISTDTGHLSGPNDAGWANNATHEQVNWGWYAMHHSVVLAKQVIKAYYGQNASYSYFSACSGGGRQGLKEIQAYPDDFDGVVAGAAPWLLSHLHPWAVNVALPNLNAPESDNVTAAAFQIYNEEVMRQCDPQDGHTDRVIIDPYSCNFDFSQITCNSTNSNTSTCLTPNQVNILKATYADWTDKDNNNALIWPAFTIAADATGLAGHADAPSSFGTEYVANFIMNDTNWDWRTINASTVRLADSLDPGSSDADEFDLSSFQKRGGKLLTYHGTADPLIPTGSSIYYYESVLKAMGGVSASANRSLPTIDSSSSATSSLDDFYRLFLVPGMYHCSGSNNWAPWYIAGGGQSLPANATQTYSVPGYSDAQHDVVLAIMAWVENGTAPDRLTATAWHNDDAAQGVKVQRPLCPYPKQPVYSGQGDATDASTWECTEKSFVGFEDISIAKVGSFDPNATSDSSSGGGKKSGAGRTIGGGVLSGCGSTMGMLGCGVLAALLSFGMF